MCLECRYRRAALSDAFSGQQPSRSNNLLGATTKLNFTRIGKKNSESEKEINVIKRVKVLGSENSRALIGFYNFTGADWGGKLVGITKERWMKLFLDLTNDDEVIQVWKYYAVNQRLYQ